MKLDVSMLMPSDLCGISFIAKTCGYLLSIDSWVMIRYIRMYYVDLTPNDLINSISLQKHCT